MPPLTRRNRIHAPASSASQGSQHGSTVSSKLSMDQKQEDLVDVSGDEEFLHAAIRDYAQLSPTLGWYHVSCNKENGGQEGRLAYSNSEDMTPARDQHAISRLREELYRVAGDDAIETCKDEEPQVESRFDVQIRSRKRKDAKLKHSPANDTHDVSKAAKWKAEAAKSLRIGEELRIMILDKEEKIAELQSELESPNKQIILLNQDLRRARKDAEAFGRQVASEAERADNSLARVRELEEANRISSVRLGENQSVLEVIRCQLKEAEMKKQESVAEALKNKDKETEKAVAEALETKNAERQNLEEQLDRANMLLQAEQQIHREHRELWKSEKEQLKEALHTAERQIHELKESVMAELEERQAENETLQEKLEQEQAQQVLHLEQLQDDQRLKEAQAKILEEEGRLRRDKEKECLHLKECIQVLEAQLRQDQHRTEKCDAGKPENEGSLNQPDDEDHEDHSLHSADVCKLLAYAKAFACENPSEALRTLTDNENCLESGVVIDVGLDDSGRMLLSNPEAEDVIQIAGKALEAAARQVQQLQGSLESVEAEREDLRARLSTHNEEGGQLKLLLEEVNSFVDSQLEKDRQSTMEISSVSDVLFLSPEPHAQSQSRILTNSNGHSRILANSYVPETAGNFSPGHPAQDGVELNSSTCSESSGIVNFKGDSIVEDENDGEEEGSAGLSSNRHKCSEGSEGATDYVLEEADTGAEQDLVRAGEDLCQVEPVEAMKLSSRFRQHFSDSTSDSDTDSFPGSPGSR